MAHASRWSALVTVHLDPEWQDARQVPLSAPDDHWRAAQRSLTLQARRSLSAQHGATMMTARSRICLSTIIAVAMSHVLCAPAWGDDAAPPPPPPVASLQPGGSFLHLKSKAHLVTAKGSELDLEPGYYMDEPSFLRLDAAYKLSEDKATRFEAENKSLRESTDGWQPGWRTIAVAIGVGLAGGVYLGAKL